MEDAADALIMAGSILVFIIALSFTISSFTILRVGIDNIMDEPETVQMAKDGANYINYIHSTNATRTVGPETVISSMYRSLKENYVVYVKFKNDIYDEFLLPTETYQNANIKIAYKTDASDDGKILEFTINSNDDPLSTNDSALGDTAEKYKKIMGIFYDKIQSMEFNEFLGEYQNATASGVTRENKQTYRIITYKQI